MKEIVIEQSEWPPGTVHQLVQREDGTEFQRTLTGAEAEAVLEASEREAEGDYLSHFSRA